MGKRYKVTKPEEVKTEEALDKAIKNIEAEHKAPKYAIVNASAVNVRQKPDIESASVDILKRDEKVQLGVEKLGESFTYVFYGNDYAKAGYMMSKYLKEVN